MKGSEDVGVAIEDIRLDPCACTTPIKYGVSIRLQEESFPLRRLCGTSNKKKPGSLFHLNTLMLILGSWRAIRERTPYSARAAEHRTLLHKLPALPRMNKHSLPTPITSPARSLSSAGTQIRPSEASGPQGARRLPTAAMTSERTAAHLRDSYPDLAISRARRSAAALASVQPSVRYTEQEEGHIRILTGAGGSSAERI